VVLVQCGKKGRILSRARQRRTSYWRRKSEILTCAAVVTTENRNTLRGRLDIIRFMTKNGLLGKCRKEGERAVGHYYERRGISRVTLEKVSKA